MDARNMPIGRGESVCSPVLCLCVRPYLVWTYAISTGKRPEQGVAASSTCIAAQCLHRSAMPSAQDAATRASHSEARRRVRLRKSSWSTVRRPRFPLGGRCPFLGGKHDQVHNRVFCVGVSV